jgi:hypothetical protein
MSELRVPTVALAAQVVCADGRELGGRLFVPADASRHSGPMRAQEWLNEPPPFFPFDSEEGPPLLLNKHEVVAVTLDAEADAGDIVEGVEVPMRHVVVECGERRFEGRIAIDMPPNQCRVVDYLNRSELFLTLRDANKHHLIQKQRITRVIETGEGRGPETPRAPGKTRSMARAAKRSPKPGRGRSLRPRVAE